MSSDTKKTALKQVVILTKIKSSAEMVFDMAQGGLEKFLEESNKGNITSSFRKDYFENMKFLANDIITTIDEYLQLDKMK